MPHLGVNAAYKAARALTALEAFQFNVAPHPYLGSPTLNVGTVRAGLNVNSVPDLAEIGIDIRSIPGLDHSRIQEHLKAELGETGAYGRSKEEKKAAAAAQNGKASGKGAKAKKALAVA